MRAETIELPEYWASYLINGDASGLLSGEKAHIDAYLEREKISRHAFIDVESEGRFTWSFDLYGGTCKGGNVARYTYLED